MIVLPGPVVLRDPLPAGWVRCPELGCGAPTGHDGAHVPEAVPPVAVAGPEVDVGAEVRGDAPTLAAVAAAIDRAQRSLDAVPMPCAETMLAIDALESAETLVADLRAAPRSCTCSGDPDPACATCGLDAPQFRIPDVIDVEALADTWPAQWRSLVEADPATLTAGGMRRRAAMLAIVAHVRGEQSARAERIEAAARRLVRAQWTTYAIEATCGLGEQRSDALRAEARAFDALRAALCTCTAHGPDPACVEHGEALRAWQKRNGT